MQTIEPILQEALANYITKSGNQPSIILLGEIQHSALMQEAYKALKIPYINPTKVGEPYRVEFLGMKVYLVDSADFIAFG